jgi:hypothetical protein
MILNLMQNDLIFFSSFYLILLSLCVCCYVTKIIIYLFCNLSDLYCLHKWSSTYPAQRGSMDQPRVGERGMVIQYSSVAVFAYQ